VHLGNRDLLASRENQEAQVNMVKKETVDCKETRVHLANLAYRALQAKLAVLDHLENKATLDHLASRETLDHLGHQAYKELQETKVHRALKDLLAFVEIQVLLVR